jgi:hypothetical protein
MNQYHLFKKLESTKRQLHPSSPTTATLMSSASNCSPSTDIDMLESFSGDSDTLPAHQHQDSSSLSTYEQVAIHLASTPSETTSDHGNNARSPFPHSDLDAQSVADKAIQTEHMRDGSYDNLTPASINSSCEDNAMNDREMCEAVRLQAIQDFRSNDESYDFCFEKGDIIFSCSCHFWIEGVVNSSVGRFPVSYVEVLREVNGGQSETEKIKSSNECVNEFQGTGMSTHSESSTDTEQTDHSSTERDSAKCICKMIGHGRFGGCLSGTTTEGDTTYVHYEYPRFVGDDRGHVWELEGCKEHAYSRRIEWLTAVYSNSIINQLSSFWPPFPTRTSPSKRTSWFHPPR